MDKKAEFTLVYRVSGFQEKGEFFEVYSGAPKFDQCGRTSTLLIDKKEYDRSEGMLRGLELHGKRLTVVYTNTAAESVEPEHAGLKLLK